MLTPPLGTWENPNGSSRAHRYNRVPEGTVPSETAEMNCPGWSLRIEGEMEELQRLATGLAAASLHRPHPLGQACLQRATGNLGGGHWPSTCGFH